MFRYLLFSSFILANISCSDSQVDVLPIIGIYRSHIISLVGPFDLIISTDKGDDVIIEAPFFGDEWLLVSADIDIENESNIILNIYSQKVDSEINIEGSGFFFNGVLKLEYCIKDRNGCQTFKLVGTKF